MTVVVIGAGPTGLAAATLLAQYGVECSVLERWPSIYPRPRAVHLDDEVYRILARLGIGEQFARISRPALGLRLLDPNLRVLAEFRRETHRGRHGFPAANMFDQPELERLLRANLERRGVTVRGGAEVTGLEQDSEAVTVRFLDTATGVASAIRADYVLGCDGANSLTRSMIGVNMRDLRFAQRWLVIDLATDAELDHWEGVHQVCDSRRAATFMRIGASRYRWEFQLRPGENADGEDIADWVFDLTAPWTRDVARDRLTLVRAAEYTFRAQIAERWRERRIFLLGDAAHLTPPFIGQGMGAGLRDAMNLTWKLAGVLRGEFPERLLDSYQAERKPHARAMIRMAKLVGSAMTRGGRTGTALRAVIVPRLGWTPGISKLVLSSQTPALRRSDLVWSTVLRGGLAGTLSPNAPVTDEGHRLDDVADGRFVLVLSAEPTAAEQAEIVRRGARLVIAQPGTELRSWLDSGRARAAAVRPDGTVLCAGRNPAAALAALPAFGAATRPTGPASSSPPPRSMTG